MPTWKLWWLSLTSPDQTKSSSHNEGLVWKPLFLKANGVWCQKVLQWCWRIPQWTSCLMRALEGNLAAKQGGNLIWTNNLLLFHLVHNKQKIGDKKWIDFKVCVCTCQDRIIVFTAAQWQWQWIQARIIAQKLTICTKQMSKTSSIFNLLPKMSEFTRFSEKIDKIGNLAGVKHLTNSTPGHG